MHGILDSTEFQVTLMLFAALAGYLLSARLKQPAVVGVILAGVLIGPAALNLITYTEVVGYLGHMGAIILLFVLGLEFNVRDLFRAKYFAIALAGVLVPWVGGYVTATLFGFPLEKALIIGVALTATSLAITAATLTEMGVLKTKAGEAIIGAAILDDILALTALSVSEKLATGHVELLPILALLATAVVFLTGGLAFGVKVITPAINKIDRSKISELYPDFIFVFAMMLAFFYALLAEMLHLSAIVGAFVAGVSLEGVKTGKSRNVKEGAEYLRVIFGIVFFISLGVLADIRAFTADYLLFTVILILVAVGTKVIGCGLTAKMAGLDNRDSLIVGVGMAPRGEVAMTIALLAYLNNIIEQPALISIIVMSIVTAVLVPPLLKWLYSSKLKKA